MGGSTKTQKTTYEPKTGSQLSYEDLMMEVNAAQILNAGYIPEKQTVTKYNDEGKAKGIEAQIATTQERINVLQEQVSKYEQDMRTTGYAFGVETRLNSAKNELNAALRQKNSLQGQLTNIGQTTYDDYTLVKKTDPRIQQMQIEAANKKTGGGADKLIQEFGYDSKELREFLKKEGYTPEVVSMEKQILDEEVSMMSMETDVTRNWMTAINKLITGDIAIDPQQKAAMAEYYKPIKAVVEQTTSELLNQQDANDDALFEQINKISQQIDQTGYDYFSFLEGAQVQMEESGRSLIESAEAVNQSLEAKAKFEFDLVSKELERKVAVESALLGEAPNSSRSQKRLLNAKQDALAKIVLDLDAQNAERILGIQSGVEQGKINISLEKAGFTKDQGAKREGLAALGFDVIKESGQSKMGIKSAQANELINLEKAQSDALFGVTYGNLANSIGASSAGLNMGDRNRAFGADILGSTANIPSIMLGQEAQARAGQATTTQTSSPSFGAQLFGGLGSAVKIGQGIAKIGGWGGFG